MVEGPVSRRRFSRRQIRQAIIAGVAIIAVLIVVIVGWYMFSASMQSSQEADRQQLDEQARAHASSIAGFIKGINATLSEYVGSESIQSLFESADPARLAQEAESAKAMFPSALKVRLLLPGEYELDSTSRPPLTYGSLDILNKAERTNGTIAAEVLLFGSENQHIVLVDRVKNQSDQLIGIVHLSLDVGLLGEVMSSLQPGAAYLEIRQSGSPLVLGKSGDASLKSGDPVTTSIEGTLWTLAYWGTESMATGSNGAGSVSLFPVILLVVLILVIAGGIAIVMRNRNTGSGLPAINPGISYKGAIRAIMDGAHPGMEKLIANMPDHQASSTTIPGISTGITGDDVTMIMKKAALKSAIAAGDVLDLTATPPAKSPSEKGAATAAAPVKAKTVAASDTEPAEKPVDLPAVIFRKYDIRGVVGDTLTIDVVNKIGHAIGSAAAAAAQKAVIVGRDGRLSSPEFADSLIKGLRATGMNVIDIGIVPTPVLYFATHHLDTRSGVMITGSHNGPEYNGLKIVIAGNTLSEDGIQALYQRIINNDFVAGSGTLDTAEVLSDYVRRITDDIPVALGRAYKLVIDCGNGAAGIVAPQLYSALGHDVIEMYCDLDGRFPNHHPDPGDPKNMQALIEKVKSENADLGFAFDGDGDRLGIVDAKGNIIWPDRQLMVFARDVLSRNQGAPIIYDVKCTSHLRKMIEANGGKAVMWMTGHSLIKSKMKQMEAPLAGEMSGHIFFKERWYGFDDALYSGARMLEILLNARANPTEFFAGIPESVSTPELKIDMPESEHTAFMQTLESKLSFKDTEVITVDGFRVEFSDGWGLIRPSNTTPCLVVRFEADNKAALDRIQAAFRQLLLSIKPDLPVPF